MRKKLALFSSLLALPTVLADPVQDAFDTVFDFITPEIANYLYTFILVFAVSQFALGLVLQNRPGVRVAHPDRNSAAIAAALAFGTAFFVYLSGFDMILFTIPWILLITFGMLSLMVYRVVALFGAGTPSGAIRALAIGISLLIASAFLKAITRYIEQYEQANQISAITGLTASIFGGLNSVTGWLAVAGFVILIYAAYLWTVERSQQTPTTVTAAFAAPPTVTAGTPATFRGSATGGTGSYTYAWTFSDPAGGPAGTATSQTPTHTYATDGPSTVELIVTDSAGTASAPHRLPITVNPAGNPLPLNAGFAVHDGPGGSAIAVGGYASSMPGNPLEFIALPAPGGTPPYVYDWDFSGAPDHNARMVPAPGPNPTIRVDFNAPGPKTVALHLTDNSGGAGANFTFDFTVN